MLILMMMMWITVVLFNQIADSAQTNSMNLTISADVGDNVTLRCFRLREEATGVIVWYKQKVGHEPRVMITAQSEPSYEDEFKPPKFSIEKEKRNFHLKIADVEPSDEAMYYCGYIKFVTRFIHGTFLSVKGKADLSVSVSQRGVLESVPAGASVTLQCSVLSESRAAELQVLWFRAAPPQSHPQIIYTHHNSSHQCESGSSTHTCVYNFSKNILSLSDTGTYYCAVALCGKIIFGNGTPVQLEGSDSVVISLAVALAVCVVIIFAQAILYSKKLNSVKLLQGSLREKTHTQDHDAVELNYAALNFSERKTKSGRAEKRQPQNTVYSEVMHSPVT